MTNRNNHPDALDAATQARLARLANVPVDVSALQARLRAEMSQDRADTSALHAATPLWRRRWAPLAAAIMVMLGVIAIALVMLSDNSPAQAAMTDMATLHNHMVSLGEKGIPVNDADDIRQAVESQLDGRTTTSAPWEHRMACCLRQVKDRPVATILLSRDAAAITLAVAQATDLKPPTGRTVRQAGRIFQCHNLKDLTMVTTIYNGKFICLIGKLSDDELVEIALGLKL